LIIVFVKGS